MMSSYVVVPAVGAQRGSVSDVPKFLEEKEAFDAAYDELLLQAECIDGKLEKICSSGFKWPRMAQYGTFANRKYGCNGVTHLTSIDCLLTAVCICVPVPFIPAV